MLVKLLILNNRVQWENISLENGNRKTNIEYQKLQTHFI